MAEVVVKQGRYTVVWWMLFLFVLPVAVVLGLYVTGWQPSPVKPHGDLIQPPQAVPALTTLTAKPLAWQDTDTPKWTIVVVSPIDCDAACQTWIVQTRKVQVALNKQMGRVQRFWVGRTAGEGLRSMLAAQPDLRAALAQDGAAQAVFELNSASAPPRIYLVDPKGFVMMRYSDQATPQGLLKDLEKLLRYSWAG